MHRKKLVKDSLEFQKAKAFCFQHSKFDPKLQERVFVNARALNFITELYTFQIKQPFYLVTSNPQLVRGNLGNWKAKRVGHGSHGRSDTRINQELVNSNSRRRLSVSLEYIPLKRKRGGCLTA